MFQVISSDFQHSPCQGVLINTVFKTRVQTYSSKFIFNFFCFEIFSSFVIQRYNSVILHQLLLEHPVLKSFEYLQEPRGFGYVQFENVQDADAAVEELKGFKMKGRELDVRFAEGDRKLPGIENKVVVVVCSVPTCFQIAGSYGRSAFSACSLLEDHEKKIKNGKCGMCPAQLCRCARQQRHRNKKDSTPEYPSSPGKRGQAACVEAPAQTLVAHTYADRCRPHPQGQPQGTSTLCLCRSYPI